MAIIVIVILVSVVLVMVVFSYNGMVDKEQDVKGTWSNVVVQYQRRIDLIPTVLAAVNSSMTFEQGLLENITQLRTQWLDSIGEINQQVNATQQLDSRIGALLIAIQENYPQLESIEVVKDFIVEVEGTENRIASARIYYNDAVNDYNSFIKRFPNNIFSGTFGFEEASYYTQGQ